MRVLIDSPHCFIFTPLFDKIVLGGVDWVVANLEMGHEDEILEMQHAALSWNLEG